MGSIEKPITGESSISVVDFPECVRLRTEMYLSDATQAVDEIIDNSVDEFLAGSCNYIRVTFHPDKKISVLDNGRGIPVKKHTDPRYSHLSEAEVAFTTLHAGGKFGKNNGYGASGGLHGVGASCTNATSSWMQLTVCKDRKVYQAFFNRGVITENLQQVGALDTDFTGTEVSFILDDDIWQDEEVDYKRIHTRLKQLAYLNPTLSLHYENLITNENHIYRYDNGIQAYVSELSQGKNAFTEPAYVSEQIDGVGIQFAFSYTNAYSATHYSFCNNIYTEAGGDHLIGMNHGIVAALNAYAEDKKILKKDERFEANDCLEGIVSVIAILVEQPKFEGQAKSKIKMRHVRSIVKTLVREKVFDFLDHNPSIAQDIFNKIQLSQKARLAAQYSRELVRKKSGLTGHVKGLMGCSEKDASKCEIFIVEGDSAGGTAGDARDRKTQAILPIFGKILNTEKKADISTDEIVLDNAKLEILAKALECNIGDNYDFNKLRYHKIVILSDADVDGAHIQTLYLTFFYRYYRELIEKGMIYMAMPPLFSIMYDKKQPLVYAFDEGERDRIIQSLEAEGKKVIEIKRYKGLGEMNPPQLWETTMNPETRTLVQITLDNLESAEETLQICMGKAVPPRKAFIEENAQFAQII